MAQALLEKLTKQQQEEVERSEKIADEQNIGGTSSAMKDIKDVKSNPEERKRDEGQYKSKVVVAIDEHELNKVELAYFKRPTNVVILSDKDANRLLKGQDVPHLHGDKKILQGYGVQINGTVTSYNYDDHSG